MIARAWLEKARGDLAAARRCSEALDVPGWVIGFHCQQAVEKALKGLLILLGCEAPRTHDVARLADLILGAGGRCPVADESLEAVAPFAVDDRYPLLSAPEVARSEVMDLVSVAAAATTFLEAEIARVCSGG
jgi:HEPN domain-containing protein